MALLEVLPDFVENTLREIRAREPEASDPLPLSPGTSVASDPLIDTAHAVVATQQGDFRGVIGSLGSMVGYLFLTGGAALWALR